MSVAIIIPARFASTRFPGKPLVMLRGRDGVAKPLIQRTWEAGCLAAPPDQVYVATDDQRIADVARDFGAQVIMTSTAAVNGTERCAEAIDRGGLTPSLVVNLQGDAPLTPPWFIADLIAGMQSRPDLDAATPVLRCDRASLAMLLEDRRHGRVGGTTAVFDANLNALYFSKEVIPYIGSHPIGSDADVPVFHHVGIYAYRPAALRAYSGWPAGPLEQLEGLEQLRFVENGARLGCVVTQAQGKQFWELNNPEDVARIEEILARGAA